MAPMSLPAALLPAWIRHYPRHHLRDDVLAGLIVAVLVVPQSLAYALLAGLPPQAGLYASIVPVVVYALVGSSNTQSMGPVAITAIMTASVLAPLAQPGTPQYVALAATLALMSGALVLAFGLLRLGFLSQLLSRPVVSGFISGSAALIILSQCKFLLGVPAPSGPSWAVLLALWQGLPQAHLPTVALAVGAVAVLALSRSALGGRLVAAGLSRAVADGVTRFMPLGVVAVSTALVVGLDLDTLHGVVVVGPVPEGLGGFTTFWPGWDEVQRLAGPALVLAFIGMVQNITMAQALAIRRRERLDANRELVGLGASNVAAAFCGGMPVGGGMSRTAINLAAGAQTPLASVVTGVAMLGLVWAGTRWFAHLPLVVLAATISVAAFGMIDLKALRQAWGYDRADALALLGTALGVLVLGLQAGIVLGIALSLATLLLRASTPHIAVIGRIAGTEHFRNVERHGVETLPGVLLLRIDESLFFGNLSAVEARLGAELAAAPDTHDVVLIMSAVNRVDTTAMEVLTDLHRELLARGIRLHLAEVKGPVQDRLMRTPLWQALQGQVHLSVNAAFEGLGAPVQPHGLQPH
ncbi:SulP family inorganic anion transporter [Hydrogenophaga soli]